MISHHSSRSSFTLKTGLLLAITFALSACAVGPDYHRPELPLPAHYPLTASQPHAEAATPEISPRWWEAYQDTALTQLIERALNYNADALQAAARVEQADALDRQASAARWPGLNAGGSATRSLASSTTQPAGSGEIANGFKLTGSASFELDFWGRLRRASEATRAQTLATRYGQEVVRQTVASQVALGYFELLRLDRQLALSQSTLASRGEDLRLQQSRLAQGSASRLEFEQTGVSQTEAALQVHEYERQRALVLSRLALLSGTPDLDLDQRAADLPTAAALPPAGLPSELLARRPDVRQAEQLLAAANARIGVAQAARLPSVSLTGMGGAESADLADLLRSPSRIWSLGLGLDLPIFDAGRRAAAVDQARAEYAEAQAAWQAAAHSAFKDVADALANLRAAQTSWQDAERREQLAVNTLVLTRKRHAAGYSSALDLLEAQRAANAAQIQMLGVREAQLGASVALYKALGGGWSGTP